MNYKKQTLKNKKISGSDTSEIDSEIDGGPTRT